MSLCRHRYRKQSPWCLISMPLEVEMATDKLKKNTNHQVLIQFWQNWLKEVGPFIMGP